MRTVVVLALFTMVSLAGCVQGDDDSIMPDECDDAVLCDPDQFFDTHYCNVNDIRPRVYAPDVDGPDSLANPWELGRYWTFSLALDGEQLDDTKLVYYDLQDNDVHYMVGTPTRDEALQHAVYSTNPVIGRVHRTLYSPHESGAHADMFHFPLCEGSTWTDVFFDTAFDFIAYPFELELPDGSTDPLGFVIEGKAADGSTIIHTYSPAVKWFTTVRVEKATGQEVNMELVDFGTDYQGDAFFLRGQRDEVVDIGDVAQRSAQQRNEIVERSDSGEPYDTVGIAIDVQRVVGTGRAEVRVVNPNGDTVACVGFDGDGFAATSTCDEGPILLETPYVQGDWDVQVDVPLLGGTELEGTVRLTSIYDRSGTIA